MEINNSIRRYGRIQKTREYPEIVKMMEKTWPPLVVAFPVMAGHFLVGAPRLARGGSSTGRTLGNRLMEVGCHSAAGGRSGGIKSNRYG